MQGLARSAFFGWLAKPDILFGLDNQREGAREGARGFYDAFPLRSPQGAHAVDRYLSILPLLNVPLHWNFEWLPTRPSALASIQRQWNPGTAPWVILLPGARWNNKRWPVNYFVELVRLLQKDSQLRFAVLGGSDDKALGQTIAQAAPERCLDLTGKTSLAEMIEWIRVSRLTISNDTGPMHVAAALRKPIVALFGPTDPCSTGPYCQPHNVLQSATPGCVPCFKSNCHFRENLACLHAITPAMVCAKTLSVLANISGTLH